MIPAEPPAILDEDTHVMTAGVVAVEHQFGLG